MTFSDLVLQFRGRIGLTQRDLAGALGVHVHSVQAWETGTSHPGLASLQALIATILRTGGFTTGREETEAVALWAAAMREAPRLKRPFDQTWFRHLLDQPGRPNRDDDATPIVAAAPPLTRPSALRQQSWGTAPDVAGFLGRAAERDLLQRWIVEDRCRVVSVLGLGGIGKSILAARLARDLAPSFECVYWYSLMNAPPPSAWLADVIGFLVPNQPASTGGEGAQLRRLLELLGETRCLLILDNFETVLQPGDPTGGHRPGYEGYGELVRRLGESRHQSCLLLTSRETPSELGPLVGASSPVRSLELSGLDVDEGRTLLQDKWLEGDEAAWRELVGRFSGNGLALKVIGETIRELFGGEIRTYLDEIPAAQSVTIGGVSHLLEAQIERLSAPERLLLRALAIEREPIGLADLTRDWGLRLRPGALLGAVEALRRRSLLETGERRSTFNLQPVVLEFVTERLVEDVVQELATGALDQILTGPLVKATAREYVRRSQERLIAEPLLERFVASRGSRGAAARQLGMLLDHLRVLPPEAQGYGSGNLVSLLRVLRGDLRGVDLSGLAIRQVYLQEVEAQDASLAGAHLTGTVLAQAFTYPTHVALSADGSHVVAATSAGEVYLWRLADRTLLAILSGHDGAVWGVALSPDGRLVASGGFDGTVRLWDSATGQAVSTLRGHTGGVNGVALSADGRVVASGGYDATVRLWDATTGRLLVTLAGHSAGVNGVALSGDGRIVVSGSWDGTVRVWEVETGQSLATLQGHSGGIWGVALSSDGSLVASGSFDGTVRMWETATSRHMATLQGHTGGVRSVALGDNDRLVASGSYDGTVKLWTASTGHLLATLQGHLGGVWGVALSRDGALAASASYDGTVKLWETGSRQLIASLQGQTSGVWGVALSRDGRLMASAGVDGTVKLWEPGSGRLVASLRGHTGGVWGVALSHDGTLLASGSFDGTVRLWEPAGRRLLATLGGHVGGVRGVAVSGDGRLVVSGGFDGTVKLWDAPAGRLRATLPGHAGGVWGVAVSDDGLLVASGGYDESVKLWEVPGGQLVGTLRGHAGGVRGVALSHDRRLVASSGVDETVRVWEAESGRLLFTLPGHLGGALDVVFSNDGNLVVSGSEDQIVRVWDVTSGELVATMLGHAGQVYGVAPLGNEQVASGSIDGTIRFWQIRSGACVRTLQADRRYERMDITGLTGITDAQREALLTLGAVDRSGAPSEQGTPGQPGGGR
jgi:WD40 repeat protein/transcriptional regulator with XRE-family HTH domain